MEKQTYLKRKPEVAVFEYSCYRAYLKDWVESAQKLDPHFSVRRLCQKVGMSTDNYINRIIDGRRNLGPKFVEKLILAIELKPKEADFFRALVLKGHTHDLSEQQRLSHVLSELRPKIPTTIAKIEDNSLFLSWETLVIWEAFFLYPSGVAVDQAVSIVESCLRQTLPRRKILASIDELFSKGLLIKKEVEGAQSIYFPNDQRVLSSNGLPSQTVRSIHREFLGLASLAIDRPMPDRKLRGVTVSVSTDTEAKIRQKMEAFIDEIFELAEADISPDRVMRVQIQGFELAKKR